MPFIVYNVPGRTSVNLLPETLAEMKKRVPEVVGVKEATGNLEQISRVVEFCGPDFQVLSGDDFTALATFAIGGCGVISVASNVSPKKMSAMWTAYASGDLAGARKLHYELAPLFRAMFLETNPVPAKTALSWMGKFPFETRLPMVPMLPANQEKLKAVLTGCGLL